MTYEQANQIAHHPAVSQAMTQPIPTQPTGRKYDNGNPKMEPKTGLGCVVYFRNAIKNAKQALANARDEADSGGWPNNGWTADMSDSAKGQSFPGKRLLVEALTHDDLPADLRAMIEAALAA